MKHTVWKIYWNYQKEEKWLNSMSSKGLALVDYFWTRYVFEEAKQGEYIYKIEFLEHSAKHIESKRYIGFLEEMDIECIATYMHWIYLRKKSANGPFDIYTDLASRIKKCRLIRNWWLGLAFFEAMLFVYEFAIVISCYQDFKELMIFGNFAVTILLFFALFLFFGLAMPMHKELKRLQKENKVYED